MVSFDNVSHTRLEELLRIRVGDPKLLRLIVRFLKAGVMIDGRLEATEDGVPQGASLSPLLANVYLHYVLDQWFGEQVKPRMRGECYLMRFADDFICCFEHERDAELMAFRARVRVMAKRHLSRRSQQSYLNWSDLNRFTEAHPLASPVRLTDLIALGRQRSSGRDK